MGDVFGMLLLLLGDLMMAKFFVYCWNTFLNAEGIQKKSRTIMFLFIGLFINLFSYVLEQPFRIIVTYVFLIIVNYFAFTKKTKQSILMVAISEALLWIAEFSFVLLISLFYSGDIEKLVLNPIIFLFLNVYVVFVSFLFLKTRIPFRVYNFMNRTSSRLSKREPLVYSTMIIIIIVISTVESYMHLSLPIVLTTNTILALVFILIIIKLTAFENNFYKMSSKYETSINSLKEYEKVIDKFRINNHENKNELLTIRNMIKNKDDGIVTYIDNLIDYRIKDNEKILNMTYKIPECGLRATIYSKLCLMDESGINYVLDISTDVKTVDLIDLNDNLVLNMCKIIGVFLDNAIEESQQIKDGKIKIEIYIIDDKLYIDITNDIEHEVDINKIEKVKYSTKGEGHGYGLSLVNEILDKNKSLFENETVVSGDKFTQSLQIKIK